MHTIRLTTKRQATFPRAVCEQLGVGPGDELELIPRTVDEEEVWVLKPVRPAEQWVGSLRAYAKGKSHRWEDVEQSIERGWASDDRS